MRRLFLILALVLVAVPVEAASDITFLQVATSTADTNSYTFSAQNLGTEAADRCIVIEIASRRGVGTVTTVDTVTVAGNSATVLEQLSVEESSAATVVAIAAVAVPTGTSGDVVVTFSASMLRAEIALSRMIGADTCTTASDTDESELDDPSVSLDIPDDGSAVAVCGNASASGSATWTGLTERHDAILEAAFAISGASDDFSTPQTGLTITCTWNVSSSGEGGVFVSWAPDVASAGAPARVIGGGVF